jgi:DNA-binding NarL/FixJ family response regulator
MAVPELSGEETELLRLLASGLSAEAMARRLHTSERTVRRRVKALCDRLGYPSAIQVVVWAVRQGLL